MKEFIVKVKTTNYEIWSVKAESVTEAREKVEELDGDVDIDKTGGDLQTWDILSIMENN